MKQEVLRSAQQEYEAKERQRKYRIKMARTMLLVFLLLLSIRVPFLHRRYMMQGPTSYLIRCLTLLHILIN